MISNANLSELYPISVVIPVRDGPGDLRQCLRGLLKNDLRNVEILVVDDASEADTSGALPTDAEARGIALIYLKLSRRSGPAGARNEGLSHSTKPFVLFLDADIVLPEGALQWIRETLHAHSHRPAVVAVMGVYSRSIPWDDFLSNFKNLYVSFLQETTPDVCPFVHSAIFCIKKEALERFGGFDSRTETAEDFRLGIILGTRGCLVAIDRRVQGVHLKRYSLQGLLREDYKRVRDLQRIPLRENQRAFYVRANRLSRIFSLVLPGPAVLLTLIGILQPLCLVAAAVLLIAFLALNIAFLRYCQRARGVVFASKSAAFLLLEALWAEACLAVIVMGNLTSGKASTSPDPPSPR